MNSAQQILAPAELAGALAEQGELSEALRTLSSISDNLLAAYSELSTRAERMDRELAAANLELERKVSELDATRAHLEAVLQALPTGVVVRDERGRIVRVNPAACAILGESASDLLATGESAELLGSEALGETREITRPDGEVRVVEQRWSEIAAQGGSVAGSVEILDDRTELARLTERVHSLDKLAALGSMAAGIAHEIRNPMNAVRGFADLLRREFQPGTRQERWSALICEGVDEADVIIANMLSFGAPERLRLESVDPTELVDSALALARGTLDASADPQRWVLTQSVHAPRFQADRIKLRQALRNLIANALQAQPNGGRVHVALEHVGGELRCDVYDAGPGIPHALRRRVTEPFFTTRAEGSGLGLSLVHTIAELHGGRFQVSPAPAPTCFGGGAHMTLILPFQPAK